MKYLIFGNGYLGNQFNDYLGDEGVLSELRISDERAVVAEIEKHNPEFVINCLGKTGRPNVDWCEEHKVETMHSNVIVPALIQAACEKKGKKMVHLSSGCLYSGDKNGRGFSEEDEPNFYGSFYSRTKILAERILKEFDNVLIIRPRMPLDGKPSVRNLLDKLLKYEKVISINNSISVIDDLLRITKELMECDASGVFNVVNKGAIKHDKILGIFSEASGRKLDFEVISAHELDAITLAKRSNCVLSVGKLESLGIEVPEVHDAVKKCVAEYVMNLDEEFI